MTMQANLFYIIIQPVTDLTLKTSRSFATAPQFGSLDVSIPSDGIVS